MIILWLALASSAAWLLSSLIGGGSPLILIPVISALLGPAVVPPVLTTGMLFGNGQRVWIYWQQIEWRVVVWCLPGATVGAVLGAFVLSRTRIEWLSLLLAIFLLLSVLGLLRDRPASDSSILPRHQMAAWMFLPLGFFYAFFSGLIGSTGPILHPFYLSYGLNKEEMLATKSLNVLGVHLVKLLAYGLFGILSWQTFGYGLVIGVAALPGNYLGQWVLTKISDQQFRRLVVIFIGASGLFLFWQQRQFLGFGF
ncbi:MULTISPECIES: sulfite exporter TauE/SafE family protein [Spirulina]|uniref:sulfite exporter TauE/SafE family protein n=1 Tax=Spirulina TaxID=1154 RepID=UPI00232E44BA|nr:MULTISPECIES: sulfite exporter TauE/SafE family protein [Spirulina]